MIILDLPVNIRPVLGADAILTGIAGLGTLGLASLVGPLFGLPVAFLQGAAVILIVYAAAVAFVAGRSALPNTIVAGAIIGNLLWAVGCLAAMALLRENLTLLGYVFLGAQVVFVLVFADLQFLGLRRKTAAA